VLGGAVAAFPGRVNEPATAAAVGEPAPPTRALLSPRPAEPTDREKLQGTWVVVAAESNGESILDPGFRGDLMIFAGARVTYRSEGREDQEGTYHLDPTQPLRVLDVKLGKDVVMNFIYQVTDTRLTLCWRKGGPRPTGFDT